MQNFNGRVILIIVILILPAGLILLAGCEAPLVGGFLDRQLEAADAIDTVEPDTPAIMEPTDDTSEPQMEAIESTAISLTIWAIERFSLQDEIIGQQIARFEQQNPDIQVEILLNRPSGQASTINFLRSAYPVAPSVLPDIVILNTADLGQAWRGNLIQPLRELIDPGLVQDLLPAARELATVDDNLVGIPFEMDVEHLVYNPDRIISPPLSWSFVVSQTIDYQFPADGQTGLLNDTLLIQYLATEPDLMDEQGLPVIDQFALRNMLDYLHQLRTQGVIDARILDSTYADDLWQLYLDSILTMTHVPANQFLTSRRIAANAQAAPIPAPDGKIVTIGRGWAFALVTEEQTRQAAGARLIEFLMETDNNLAWNRQEAMIPTRSTALNQMAGEDPYWLFLQDYLNYVQAPPSFQGYEQLSRILLVAMQQVISGEATPEEALETANQALSQSTF